MQIQINNPETGEMKRIEELGEYEPQALIDHVIAKSAEDAGYHVIAGDNLDDAPTSEVAHVVAALGILIFQNVLNPA